MSLIGDVGYIEAERLILSHSEKYMTVISDEVLRATEVGEVYSLSTLRDRLTRPVGQWFCTLVSGSPAFQKTGRDQYRRIDLAGVSVEIQKTDRKEIRAKKRACLELQKQI